MEIFPGGSRFSDQTMPEPEFAPITAAETKSLLSDLADAKALILAVSGGPDSMALLWLAARWRKARKRGPRLIAVTVEHGLRRESKAEAASVARFARQLGVAHRTLRWTGKKPKAGLPQAARVARYRLLAQAARRAKASHVLTAHTLDDQAETVMIRMMRGSGMTGLAAMQKVSPLPEAEGIFLARPLLDIPKSRLIATLRAEKIAFADDPTNRDAKFTRARLRGLMPRLAQEGLDARRLALLARRLKRADRAIEAAAAAAEGLLAVKSGPAVVIYDRAKYALLPDEIALRLLGRALSAVGDEGPVELAKLEALAEALSSAQMAGSGFRRSLAGALVTLAKGQITVERAPPRRAAAQSGGKSASGKSLTKRRVGRAEKAEKR
jgi:tRNA(Ile)-lysidine synthase